MSPYYLASGPTPFGHSHDTIFAFEPLSYLPICFHGNSWIRSINVIDRQTPEFFCCHYLGGDILRFFL